MVFINRKINSCVLRHIRQYVTVNNHILQRVEAIRYMHMYVNTVL